MNRTPKILNIILVILQAIPLVAVIGLFTYIAAQALQDSEGGGWVLFIMFFIVPLVLIPLCVQTFCSTLALVLLKRERYLGVIISCIGSFLASILTSIAIEFNYIEYFAEENELKYSLIMNGAAVYFGICAVISVVLTVFAFKNRKQQNEDKNE